MKRQLPIRIGLAAALLSLLAAPAYARWQGGTKGAPPRLMRQPPPPPPPRQQPNVSSNAPRQQQRQEQKQERIFQRQGHLPQWIQNHSNMSLPDQQKALQNEPGFRELPPETQQRELNQLARLYSMPAQQRSRQLDRLEAFEGLSPAQRQQYTAAARQLGGLPQMRKSMIAHAMLDMREMSPAQREQVMNSPAFAQEFPDPNDREMVRTLLMAEPYPPAH